MLLTGSGIGVAAGAVAGIRSARMLRRARSADSPSTRRGFVAFEVAIAIAVCGVLMVLITQTSMFGPDRETKMIRLVALGVLVGVSYAVARFDYSTHLADEYATLFLGGAALLYVALVRACSVYLCGIAIAVVASYRAGRESLGQGDITYMSVLALMFPPIMIAAVLLLGCVFGIVYGGVKWLRSGDQRMALLPALAAATVLVAAQPGWGLIAVNPWVLMF
jgi:prepilin signal peptidase PulO-like enzyme (type II secretory pathway)